MISVIVPFKNSREWIGRCLDSLVSQDGDFEFLIVNDHSDDGGDEIVKGYKDERLSLLDNERGAGVSGARNTGLDHSKGEWITFLDADDEMLPGAWNTFKRAIRDDANLIQFNHIRRIARTGREGIRNASNCGSYGLLDLPEYWWGVWNKLARKGIFERVRFDESLQYGEDGMFILECLKIDGRIYHSDGATVRHNIENMDSLSHRKTAEDLFRHCRAYEDFMLKQTDPKLQWVVCQELVKVWDRAARKIETSFTS